MNCIRKSLTVNFVKFTEKTFDFINLFRVSPRFKRDVLIILRFCFAVFSHDGNKSFEKFIIKRLKYYFSKIH